MIFHRDIGFPTNYRRPVGRYALVITKHARRQSEARGITLSSHLDMRYANVIEVGFKDGGVADDGSVRGYGINHLLVRVAYDRTYDLVMAVKIEYGKWILKTVWLNEITDKHTTLDRAKYAAV